MRGILPPDAAMSRLDELRHVAGLIGIQTRHVDALGVWHEPSEDTLAALIGAFGLPADPQQAADRLAGENAAAPFGLSPVQIVAQEAADPAVSLRLPNGSDSVEWYCRFEDGAEASGRSDGSALRLPAPLPLGYHRLALHAGDETAEIELIVAPPSCHLPEGLRPGRRNWGLTTQLYGLRSARDWGIGDFTDLGWLARAGGRLGAATIGINPLHALFAAEPRHFSPYSPSSRIWLNALYIDVTVVPGFAEDDTVQALAKQTDIDAARASEFVDYQAVAGLKRPVLEELFRKFQARSDDNPLRIAFREFQLAGGAALADFALFEALHERFTAERMPFSWHSWPAAMRDPRSAEVADFARAHADRVDFFQWLQWEADRQLAAAAKAGRDAGLALGLYRDLAVGVDPHGADAWADQALIAPGASIGAPPDPLSRAGQNWGLAPVNPLQLRRRAFAPLVAGLRANMRHAGILRIDHVMGLQRLYCIPTGMPATAGAYVSYPFDEILRLVALESRRQSCAIIGEDLGTVPDGFRERMRAANALSYRVFVFERRGDASFAPPSEYPPLAAASAATHDLATLKGFWLGHDIEWRRRLGIYPDEGAAATESAERRRDRHLLLDALAAEGLLPRERFGEFLADDTPAYMPELGEAIHVFLARSRARLVLVQLEDAIGEGEQANLPGTSDSHPNWQRRLASRIEEIVAGAAMTQLAWRIEEARRQAASDTTSE
jgi:4-alpha-glucanotransferase